MAVLRKQYEADVNKGNLKIEINRDSVEVFLKQSETMKKLRKSASAAKIRKNNSSEGVTELIKTLSVVGIASIEDLDDLLRSKNDLQQKFSSYYSIRKRAGVYAISWSDAFLVRMSVLFALPREAAIKALEEVSISRPKAADAMRSLLETDASH